jgi:hypothetical protein
VTVAPGATSANFGITTSTVATQTLVTVSATYGGATKTTNVTVNPAPAVALTALALSPTSLRGGGMVTGTVTLSAPAPVNGVTVTLLSSRPGVAAVPATVIVAGGATSKSFTITTTRPSKNTSLTISASYAGVTKSAALTVTRR